MKTRRIFAFIIGPVLSVSILSEFTGTNQWQNDAALAIAILMATWWITEIVPIAVTSLLPVVLFPLLGVLDAGKIASSYFNDVIFLFLGGFLIAISIEKWGLHERIALKILLITGFSTGRILFGFMFATAALSMWISNSAAAMMMIPILVPVISSLSGKADPDQMKKISVGLVLGIAYAASAGGIGTLVGTPPNLAFARIYTLSFPENEPVSFAQWFIFAIPLMTLIFLVIWIYLYFRFIKGKGRGISIEKSTIKEQYTLLGSLSREERVILIVFIVLCILWMTRASLPVGSFTIPGWAELFPKPDYITDGVVAVFMSVVLFIYPSHSTKSGRILNWEMAREIPWDIILLFGGGFALTEGIMSSGLSTYLSEHLKVISGFHPFIVIMGISLFITFLTELTSNTATVNMALPILAGISGATQMNPLLLMIPATISASMAFMLPVATPPNAIVFSTGKVPMRVMAQTGLWLNLLMAVLISLYCYLFTDFFFD